MAELQKLWELLMVHARPWSSIELAYIIGIEGILFVISLILLIRHKIRWYQMIALLLMWPYIAAVLQSCVFTRGWKQPDMELHLFWSWKLALQGNQVYVSQIILNILLLMPAGLLLPFVWGKPAPLWASVLLGLGLSLCIESLQYLLSRGLFELDDLFNNTLGCLIGTVVVNIPWMILRWICSFFKRR